MKNYNSVLNCYTALGFFSFVVGHLKLEKEASRRTEMAQHFQKQKCMNSAWFV